MDLTGYTWVGNNSLTITNGTPLSYNINGSYEFSGGNSGSFTALTYYNQNIGSPSDPMMLPTLLLSSNSVYVAGWQGPAPVVIEFIGGTDATNPTLIAWLEANGTLIAPVSSGKTKLGTLNIAKKMFGTLPIVKEVVDGMVVYEKQSTPSYEVELYDSYGGDQIQIYDGTDATGTYLGYYGPSTATVNVSSGHLFIQCSFGWRYSGSNPRITATGGVTLDSYTSTTATFTVTGNGRIETAAYD